MNDFKECVAIKKADDEKVDLAIIQLKDKTTPQRIANVFSINKQKDIEKLKLNDNVYMIGFNHGISLANTENGIKSQFTHGTITQDPDANRILYSIPTLPGSSGSPIIDKWGNLVAINFAKTSDFQGFSFGVPSIQLTSLYNNNPIKNTYVNQTNEVNNFKEQVREQETRISTAKPDSYYENQIKKLLKAEDKRNFNTVINYYDLNNIKRYWDNLNPSYDDLSKAYYKSWKTTSSSTNKVISINKEWERIYDVNLDFVFYHKRKEEWKTVNSTVRFVFGQTDKIIEVYGIENKTQNQPTTSPNNSSRVNNTRVNNVKHLYTTTFNNPPFELSLYEKPNINSSVRYKCPKNAQVKVIEKYNNTFYKVIVDGYSGYVSKKWLKRQF